MPDLGQFIRRENKTKIHNTVHFLLGGHSIEASGIVIAQQSTVLLNLVTISSDINADEFADDPEAVQDCLEMLYGDEVRITVNNIQTIVKFCVKFEVDSLFKQCLDFIRTSMTKENVYAMISIGLLVQNMTGGKHEILSLCKQFLLKDFQSLKKIGKTWLAKNEDMLKFLMQKQLLDLSISLLTVWVKNDEQINKILDLAEERGLTVSLFNNREESGKLLKVLTEKAKTQETNKRIMKSMLQEELVEVCVTLFSSWVTKDEQINMILDLAEERGMTVSLFSQGKKSDKLLEVLTDKVEVLATSKRIMKLTSSIVVKAGAALSSNGGLFLKDLLSEDYLAFSLDVMLCVEEKYHLRHVEFVEIILNWIQKNKSPQTEFIRLWVTIRQNTLNWKYVSLVKNNILRGDQNLPNTEYLGDDKYYEYFMGSLAVSRTAAASAFIRSGSIRLNDNVTCQGCKNVSQVTVEIRHGVLPCYVLQENNHISVDHWFVRCGAFSFYSMVTHNFSEILKECNKAEIDFHYLYKCTKHAKTRTVK